ncbi:ras-related protein Rab-20-like isoform X2 [Rhopilema esculentum]|uniref:ras-related protein Rab-20-like isoform X2 n=1 Tax=Rhopilema esculentum TaxID=499914 RepID=UPI0031DF45F5|eukprot:gene12764-3496_t
MNTPESQTNKKRKADFKVVIIGDAAIGKTCIVNRYLHNQFSDEMPNTIGAAFFLKQWKSSNIAIWDTAGEERFSGLSNFYCRGANAAIVAYDIRDRRTFDSIDARYTQLLETSAENCTIVLAGTKKDLVTRDNREISVEDGIKKVKELGERWQSKSHPGDKTPFFETSAKTSENIMELFEYIFETLTLDVANPVAKDTIDFGKSNATGKKCSC